LIDVPPAVVVLGLVTGLTYGILAIGLVLCYRMSGVINFALGNAGGLAAAIMGRLSLQLGLPWIAVFPVAIAAGAGASAALELGVIRRLRGAPRIMAVVATLGAGQLLLGLAGSVSQIRSSAQYPPPFRLSFSVGALVVTPYYVLILMLSPVIVAALALFLAPPEWLPRRLRSRYGPALRAASDDPEAARTVGIPTGAMATTAWAIAGALAAFAAALVAPARGFQTVNALGPDLLVRALAPAVLAGMSSLPVALAAGAAVGIFESVANWNARVPGVVDAGLFLAVGAGLLVWRRRGEVTADASWLTLPVDRPVAARLRRLGSAAAILAISVAVLAPLVLSNALAATWTQVFALATIGLSLTVVTGMSGQISLGQFAVAGVGAFAGYLVFVRLDVPWIASVLAAAAAGGASSFVIGLPALRLRGPMLAVTSLAFAVLTPALLGQRWAFGTGADPGRPIIGTTEIITGRSYYYVALGVLLACALLVRNLKSYGIGRLLAAIRDGEDVARSFGVRATARKLQAYAVSGVVAGLGGVVYAQAAGRLTIDTFPAARSVSLLSMVVLGGVGRVLGSVLGAAYLVGLPALVPDDTVALLVSGLGLLVFVLYVPGGFSQLLDRARDAIARGWSERAPLADLPRTARLALRDAAPLPEERAPPVLIAENITVRYGHVAALDDMSLRAGRGETLGIIGPNGSGKTTLFKVLSGFVRPSTGTVRLAGRDVSHLTPEARARLGLIRSFQDSMLFPTLTVVDAVCVALERLSPTHLLTSALAGAPRPRRVRSREARARELVDAMGLTAFRDNLVGELSTGTRRICELCCMLALQPSVLLLDEPSSGIAQRETEALGDLLLSLKARLGLTLVVIEHDMPLIMRISDRIVAMASGTAIAEGTPSQVQADPAVIESYLGPAVRA
jgi:ABC-type branched-subunit amino acid transport system ATPase component/ABC-type branched-subunit amino acid transport system permease subunit